MSRRPRLRVAIFVVALVALVGLGRGSIPVAVAATEDVGHRDFSFVAGGVSNPTSEKTQSKLWFNDGSWWGVLFERSKEEYHIYRYDWASHSWSDTGTLVDGRNLSRADALWDGDHLYVASAMRSNGNGSMDARVMRYSYDAAKKSYSLDEGFPVSVASGRMAAIVLAKDTAGKLWVTYTQSGRVYVNHSDLGENREYDLQDDLNWAQPSVLPVSEGTSVEPDDDLSSVIAFDGKVGVMWSNQIDDAFYFATHEDGDPEDVWRESTALKRPGIADDHINLKADSSGRVYAAVKTSLDVAEGTGPETPVILLLVREKDGGWTDHVFGREGDAYTRPIVLLDEERDGLYVFATSPCCDGGKIYYKRTSMDDINFPEGRGTLFMRSTTDTNINGATSTKQNLDSRTGLLVEASDNTSDYYLHNRIDLGETTPPAAPTVDLVSDTGASDTDDLTNDATPTFGGNTEAGSTVAVYDGTTLLGTATAAATGDYSFTVPVARELGDGEHRITARATDGAGNTSVPSAALGIRIDKTAPNTTLDAGPSGAASSGSATFKFSSEAGAVFECALDGGAFADCTSPKEYAGLPDGEHTFKVRAADAAGNADSSPASRAWTVDTVAPDAPVIESPADDSRNNTGSIVLSGTAEAGSEVEVFDGSASRGTAAADPDGAWSKELGGVAEGAHTYTARVTDAAGNTSATSNARTVTVDTTAPRVAGVSPEDRATEVDVTAVVEAAFSEDMAPASLTGSTFTLTREGSDTPVTATVSYDAETMKATLEPGSDLDKDATYTATIKGGTGGARDAAGNPLGADKRWSFEVVRTSVESTTLTLAASPTLVDYGATTTLSGTLSSSSGPLPDRTVKVWRSTDGGGTWAEDGTAAYDDATGTYKASRALQENTTFRLGFAEELPYGASTSPDVTVQARAYLSSPVTRDVVRRNAAFTIEGELKPDHLGTGGTTRLYFYRYAKRKGWLFHAYVDVPSANYDAATGKYALSYKLPSKGHWYVTAYHADADHAETWSPNRYFRVR